MTLYRSAHNLASNLWWTWNQETFQLFSAINKKVWDKTHNPVIVLKETSDSVWANLESNTDLVQLSLKLEGELEKYLSRTDTWFKSKYSEKNQELIAYFSAEYGIHESLPIYSGGLGVLSGDHTKSASDLGIPMVFIGLFYKDGYFIQQIDKDGHQVDVYHETPPENLPLKSTEDSQGNKIFVELDFPGRKVKAQVWTAQIGMNPLYLLDTNIPENSEEDRKITARLYGGNREMRISQEIVLGFGGIKLLKQLNLDPTCFHMNEGHSGFFQIERIRETMKNTGLNFEEAKVLCSSNCVFTTHTPVPAGNEAFALDLMHKYFYSQIKELDISWHRFINLGLIDHSFDYKEFSLTIFALNTSRFHNGVSELHGKIAKKMWRNQWKDVPESENPISHITNGIHVPTWMSLHMKELLNEELGPNWPKELSHQDFWKKAESISPEKFNKMKSSFKESMIELVRTRLKEQLLRNGENQSAIDEVDNFLRPEILTIGFARRFATYKRATLIFKDEKKLAEIINSSDRPVQFIFAGKAHPQDIPGQEFIEEIYKISRKEEFKGKVIILENYDMNISRHLVAGCDIWLNNPRRPMEASGTSGQKVPINGGLNFSVLDGWWREGHNGENGWAIGKEIDYPSNEVQDFEDAYDFYQTLTETILPLYYEGEKNPLGGSYNWIKKCLVSLSSNIARYSTFRMVQDYTQKFYLPSSTYSNSFEKDNFKKVHEYIDTRRFLLRNWDTMVLSNLHFVEGKVIEVHSEYEKSLNSPSHHVDFTIDETLPGRVFETAQAKISLELYLGDIKPEDIILEATITEKNKPESFEKIPFEKTSSNSQTSFSYALNYKSENGRPKRLRIRVRPSYSHLSSDFEFGLVKWL